MFEMVAVISIAIIAALALIMLEACILFVQKTNEIILNDMRESKQGSNKEKG